jgi:hypothetical protein
MKRYFVQRPRLANIDEHVDGENYLARTVYETEYEPFETGILDADGKMIMAQYEKPEIGFRLTEFVNRICGDGHCN